jgi:hypothetical protein
MAIRSIRGPCAIVLKATGSVAFSAWPRTTFGYRWHCIPTHELFSIAGQCMPYQPVDLSILR